MFFKLILIRLNRLGPHEAMGRFIDCKKVGISKFGCASLRLNSFLFIAEFYYRAVPKTVVTALLDNGLNQLEHGLPNTYNICSCFFNEQLRGAIKHL